MRYQYLVELEHTPYHGKPELVSQGLSSSRQLSADQVEERCQSGWNKNDKMVRYVVTEVDGEGWVGPRSFRELDLLVATRVD